MQNVFEKAGFLFEKDKVYSVESLRSFCQEFTPTYVRHSNAFSVNGHETNFDGDLEAMVPYSLKGDKLLSFSFWEKETELYGLILFKFENDNYVLQNFFDWSEFMDSGIMYSDTWWIENFEE